MSERFTQGKEPTQVNAYRITTTTGRTFHGFGRSKAEGFRNGCRKAGVPTTVLTSNISEVRPNLPF